MWLLAALFLSAPVHAAFSGGALLGVDVPLEAGSSSEVGPNLGLYGGLVTTPGTWRVRPELMARFNPMERLGVLALGATATAGGPTWRPGFYGHVGSPVLGGYFFLPSGDGGVLVESALESGFTAGFRLGYQYAAVVHMKCGPCPQASDHGLQATVSVGW